MLRNSKYCVALPGSSKYSFRFYEALEAGCIPVILDEWVDWQTGGERW